MTTTIDPTATAAGASTTAKLDSSRSRLADSEQTFLSLLTTQLKNQDPLSPLDSNEFTAQIVQMTGVEQQLMTNDLLKMLVGMSDGGLSGSVNLIGKAVTAETSQAMLADGAKLFKSVLYPSVPFWSWMNCGTVPPDAPGVRKLHLL